MKKTKRIRNVWLFSGLVWGLPLFRSYPSKNIILNAATSIFCFICAYTEHKSIDKSNT